MKCNILSHPDIRLSDHLNQVKELGMSLFHRNRLFPEFKRLLEICLIMHDLGKAHPDFQKKIRGKEHHTINHGIVSAQWIYFLLLESGFSPIETYIGFNIVYSHHGNLKNPREASSFDIKKQQFQDIYYDYLNDIFSDYIPYSNFFNIENFDKFCLKHRIFTILDRRTSKKLDEITYVSNNYLYSILIHADKHSAIFKGKKLEHPNHVWNTELIKKFKLDNFTSEGLLNNLRDKAFVDAEKNISNSANIYSINLPTGFGKTLTAVNIAIRLRNRDKKSRIIYCLPFTSIIDQNADVLETILEHNKIDYDNRTLLKQHHLVDYTYLYKDKLNENESKFLLESWESEFIVTTMYQFLNTLVSNINRNLVKLSNIANSVIILDEVQNIPFDYWLLTKFILQLYTEKLNITIVMVTATMPLIFDPYEIQSLVDKPEFYYSKINRIVLDCSLLTSKMSLDELVDLVIEESDEYSSQLIILNTVQSSLDFFITLKEFQLEKELVYLSTNIIPARRLEIIKMIQNNSDNKIIVSTQLVEAGVDISVDKVYRDLAPLDSIFQSAGRCNRHNKSSHKGIVSVIEIETINHKTYWQYIYDQYLIGYTKKILNNGTYQESDFFNLARQFYFKVKEFNNSALSKSIIENIQKLNYDDILGKKGFELINELPSFACYVTIDETAENLMKKYYDYLDKDEDDKFLKLTKIKALRKKMAKYTVTLPLRFKVNSDDYFIIKQDDLSMYYDKETGFKRESRQEDYIF